MKRTFPFGAILLSFFLIFNALSSSPAQAQEAADRIVGLYSTVHQGEAGRVRVFKNADGSYSAQVCWVQNKYDRDGKVRLDEKNPDKSLRNVPCDRIMTIQRMRYNAEKKCWTDAKIYDPVRGIRANVKCYFGAAQDILYVRGSLMGISETHEWKKIK